MRVDGAVAVVTGGQRGLGKALVEAFLAAGAAKVYATARAPQPSRNPRIVPIALDVTDPASVTELAARTGDTDIVVNNAAGQYRHALVDADLGDVRSLFETNVYGPLRVAQQFAPVLARNGGGVLVNIMSLMSWTVAATAGNAAYAATKAALWSLTNALRVELAGQGTRVIGAHLGYLQTDMTASLNIQKLDPAAASASIVEAIAAGTSEVLVGEDCRHAKTLLSGPPESLTFQFVDGRIVFAGDG